MNKIKMLTKEFVESCPHYQIECEMCKTIIRGYSEDEVLEKANDWKIIKGRKYCSICSRKVDIDSIQVYK